MPDKLHPHKPRIVFVRPYRPRIVFVPYPYSPFTYSGLWHVSYTIPGEIRVHITVPTFTEAIDWLEHRYKSGAVYNPCLTQN